MLIEKLKIPETILQQFWRYNSLEYQYQLSNNLRLIILYQGALNYSQGPDFTGSKIIINDIEFLGDIEIHVNASDWDLHDHQYDKNYNNVILHVVWNNDKIVRNFKGEILPTLVLSEYFGYKDLQILQNKTPICFGSDWQKFFKSDIQKQLKRALNYRFNQQIIIFHDLIRMNRGDFRRSLVFWAATYFIDKKNRGQLEIALRTVKDSLILKGKLSEILFLLIDRTGLNINNLSNDFRYNIKWERDLAVYQNKYIPLAHEWTWKKSTGNRGLNLEHRMLQISEFIINTYQNWEALKKSMDYKSFENWFKFDQRYSNPLSKSKQNEVWVNTIGIYFSYKYSNGSSQWEDQLLKLKPNITGLHKRFLSNFNKVSDVTNKWQDHSIIHQVRNWCETLNCSDCIISSIKK